MAERENILDPDLDAINIVNENYRKKRMEFLNKKRSVLERMTGKFKKREIIYFNIDKTNPANWVLYIRNKDNVIIGVMLLHQNLKEKVEEVQTETLLVPRIDLDGSKKPIFKIFKGDVPCFGQDILGKSASATTVAGPKAFGEIVKTYADSQPTIDIAKKIFSLIEAREYDEVDEYIRDNMANLISGDVEAAPTEQRQKYIELYVAWQQINKTKTTIKEYQQDNKDCSAILDDLNQEYREICQKIINNELSKEKSFNH